MERFLRVLKLNNLKNTDYRAKKSKCPVLPAQFEGKLGIWGKIDFLEIFGVETNWIIRQLVKIVLDIIDAIWGKA